MSSEDARGCDIHAHDDHSPNNGSTATDLCKPPHDAHKQGIYNIYRGAKQGWDDEDEEPSSRMATKSDDAGRAVVAPPANPHLCLCHGPCKSLRSRGL